MVAKIYKGDLVEVMCGRSSDEEKLVERNARHTAEGLEFLKPDDKGRQGCVIKVFPTEGTVLVGSVNLKTCHIHQGQNQAGGIETVEALISLTKVALVDPDTKQRMRVGLREDVVERDGRARKVRVRATHGGVTRGIEQDKEI